MTTTIEQLRETLNVYGVDDSQYTDEQLEVFITQAKELVGSEYVEKVEHEDYVEDICCKRYMTNYYPVVVDSVVVLVDGVEVTPHKITEDGIIYFDEIVEGEFSCTYNQGISEGEVSSAIVTLSMYLIRDKTGQGTLSSIQEGDLKVTYATDNILSAGNRISQLVNNIRNKYKARVRLL